MSIIGAERATERSESDSGAPAGDRSGALPYFTDLNHLLRARAERTPDATAYCLLRDGEHPGDVLTYRDLDAGARAIAVMLRRHADLGDRVLVAHSASRDFLTAFFGCLYAGVIAVCTDLPRPGRPMTRLLAIAREATPRLILAPRDVLHGRAELVDALTALNCTCPPEVKADAVDVRNFKVACPGLESLALLQYTSGSIGDPKGVMVSHGNLLSTLLDLDRGWQHTSDSCMVTWLPGFHDMGLVYGLLQPLYGGFPCYLMSPAAFLYQPMRWLRAISRFRATHTAAPNFAFRLCAETAKPAQVAALDLSCVQVALNGAEPVQDRVLRQFAQTFASQGFNPDALCPGYGLAEATLKVSTKPRGHPATRLSLNSQALERGEVVEHPEIAGGRVFIGQGVSDIGARIAIVDPETRISRPVAKIGEIWVASASVAQGYWRRPVETEAVFRAHLADTGEGPFLRTGDLGFLHRGELFITGRLHDVIIIDGRNHYPQDIEATIQASHAALRPDHGAAFTVETADRERLVVVQEVRRTHLRGLDPNEVAGNIRQAVAEAHDLRVAAVVLITPGTIAKTTSGKVQRARCRADYLAGTLSIIPAVERPVAAVSAASISAPISETSHAVRLAD